jgi:hypothetical protein
MSLAGKLLPVISPYVSQVEPAANKNRITEPINAM